MTGLPVTHVVPIALAGDTSERLAALFDAHYERLYRLARRLVPTGDSAADLVQETFLRAARAQRSIPAGPAGEEAWLVRVLVNVQRDEWRKTAVRRQHAQAVKHSARLAADHESAFVARSAIWGALDMLTPRRRAVVVMHEIEGLAVSAIATLLGVTAVTVRWHLSKGRADLARVLQPCSGEHHGSG
jgi:RNA polymerase sigma-70 factor, ECF subfamily